jgi:phosphoribosyl 1,2-cyclic phosphate phosphodiesterase
MGRHSFTFLGTGAGCGVPAFFCTCPACEEARADPRARRGTCGVMVEGARRLLIDTPPDLRHQLIRENVGTVDRLLYTHAHFDHLGGLGELEYMVRLVTGERLPTYASREALANIEREFEYLLPCLEVNELEPFASIRFDGIDYTALPVTHAPGTYGYLVESPDTRLFYASDTGKLPQGTAERVLGADIVILDATFWKRSWHPESHLSVDEAIETGLALGAKAIYLTHLAMHYAEPITLVELENHVARYEGRVIIASDGLRIDL